MSSFKVVLSVVSILLAVILAYFLFSLKYDVLVLENEKRQLITQIKEDQSELHTLNAEWTYLNEPKRLKNLISTYTDLKPVKGKQVIEIDRLVEREESKGKIKETKRE